MLRFTLLGSAPLESMLRNAKAGLVYTHKLFQTTDPIRLVLELRFVCAFFIIVGIVTMATTGMNTLNVRRSGTWTYRYFRYTALELQGSEAEATTPGIDSFGVLAAWGSRRVACSTHPKGSYYNHSGASILLTLPKPTQVVGWW
eukprot:CAMPEP_0206263608 /NCGR_PEP_ID=MMETSP0047_2-20121206/28922_1 /ASSEMBLY_ACC=CAM_ASM_000192 /TAXON_ID=195065 /ORGANISM="Chroomonas mesostigmatica_cf, Strain CCMP1168" /LENGTH=143 /DNA_ID=CAMNT_0053691187 /DNA_START=1 /DNA_END=429 /DNA_ORIENTATION=-